MRIGLAVYGTTFGMGIDPASKRPTITPMQLLVIASDIGPVSYTHLTLPTNREV